MSNKTKLHPLPIEVEKWICKKAIELFGIQPERLNPEDVKTYRRPDNSYDWPKLEPFDICDSPNSANK
jgi:hypothetical protein